MKNLTSRERVKRALNHQKPDRVPIDNGGFICGIHEEAYKKLANYLHIDVEINLYDFWQRLAFMDEQILEMFHVDTRYIFAGACSDWEFSEDAEHSWVDEWGVRRKKCGYYYDVVESPLAEADLSDLDHYLPPDPADPARFRGLREQASKMFENTQYAIVGANAGSIQYLPSELVGWEKYLTKMITNQKFIVRLTDIILDWNIKFFDKYLDACGEYIELAWIGDDWGIQSGPVIRPEIFRKIFKPRMRELVDFIKTKTEAKVCLHTCGSNYWAMEDFIEVGIDAINPIQVSAHDMDTKILKKEFGERIVFWGGGCDTQYILPFGNVQDVRNEVKKRISDLSPGGGFVFTTVHNIQAGVPPENIVAIYEAVEEYGKYR